MIIIAKYFVVIPAIVWLAVLVRLPKHDRLRFIIFSATSAVLAVVLVKAATTLHQDPRPFVRDQVRPYFSSSTDNGFPSDHTAFSSLIAFILLRYYRTLGVVLLLLAIVIGTARVISGVHHGQDIVAGILLSGAAVTAAWAGEQAARKYLYRNHKD